MSENTFVVKRYNLPQKAYVDSKNTKIPYLLPRWLRDPADPPKDGSAPFLSLPTELRLHIYSYLTNNDIIYSRKVTGPFALILYEGQYDTMAYLYRSPGRVTKPRAISKQVLDLFHICRVMREELIDSCFSDRTFILEASLYRRDAGGLFVLPANPGPTAWVKRLMLVTTIEANGYIKGIGDLRPLQRMTNLKSISITFDVRNVTIPSREVKILERADNVLKAMIECIPAEAEVQFEFGTGPERRVFPLKSDRACLPEDCPPDMYESTKLNVVVLIENVRLARNRQGNLSGSLINHSMCNYLNCHEGLGCVNSECNVVITETQLNSTLALSNDEGKKEAAEIVDFATTPLPASRPPPPPPPGPLKKCVHGFYTCYHCEKGLKQRFKCWAGQVYKYD